MWAGGSQKAPISKFKITQIVVYTYFQSPPHGQSFLKKYCNKRDTPL